MSFTRIKSYIKALWNHFLELYFTCYSVIEAKYLDWIMLASKKSLQTIIAVVINVGQNGSESLDAEWGR